MPTKAPGWPPSPGRRMRDAAYERRRREDPAAQRAAELWRSGRGRGFRAMILRGEPLCRNCAERGVTTLATEVDHILGRVEHPNLTFERTNVRPLCSPCHAKRSAEERQRSRNEGDRRR